MRPTDEQQAAIDLFVTGENLAIEAGAGTGKTSTLVLMAEEVSDRGQYIAYNTAIVKDSARRFPAEVQANTAHSLAFRAVGKRFAHRLNGPRMFGDQIARALGIDRIALEVDGSRVVLSENRLGSYVMGAVRRFCNSADPEPTERHAPYIEGIDLPAGGFRTFENNRRVAREMLPYVRAAWHDLQRPDGRLRYEHGHYLKYWQLNDPKIHADYILFDEAQDANPVIAAIVGAQTHAQLVWVGDSQQQIYSFTGAINALANVPADHRTFLTQSFRFGPAVAEVANEYLEMLAAPIRLRGLDSIDSRVEELAEPRAVLARTNAGAVMAVLMAQRDGRKCHLVGGAKDILGFTKAAQMLQAGQRTDHPDLFAFSSWGQVQEYVINDSEGADLRMRVKLIDDFGCDTILAALDESVPENRADLVASTAHKAKGREWDTVQIARDFSVDGAVSDEELRLRYVACTRAKLVLDREGLLSPA